MRNKALIYLLLSVFLAIPTMLSSQESQPTNPEAKRAWGIAQMYIEESSPALAINELKKVIYNESFAPAYLKLVELCYQTGNENDRSMAEDYTQEFLSLWPERADEIEDIVALCEAKGKLQRKKFRESLIGDWHPTNTSMGEHYICFKVRRNGEGDVDVSIPKGMWDWDFINDWQEGLLLKNFDDNGVVLYETGYGKTYEGYRVKNATESGTYWVYVYLVIPFNQPELSEGKIKVKGEVKISGPNNHYHTYEIDTSLVKN